MTRNSILVLLAAVAVAVGASGRTGVTLLRGDTGWWLLGCAVAVAVAVLIGQRPAGAPNPQTRGRITPSPRRPAQRTDAGHRAGLVVQAAGPGRASAGAGQPGTQPAAPELLDYVRAPIPQALLQRAGSALVTLHELTEQRPQLLIAVNCTCGTTYDAIRRLAGWRERLPEVDVQFVTTIACEQLRINDGEPGLEALYDHHSVVWDLLGLKDSPAAVLLGADGLLAGGPVLADAEEIEQFVTDIREELDTAAVAPAG